MTSVVVSDVDSIGVVVVTLLAVEVVSDNDVGLVVVSVPGGQTSW